MLLVTRVNGPQTTTVKDVVVTHQTEEIDLPKAEVGDEDIESLRHFSNIRSIILSDNQLTDIGMTLICENLTKLRKLFINNNQITHQGVKQIGKLTNLRCLDLRSNQIGDEGV